MACGLIRFSDSIENDWFAVKTFFLIQKVPNKVLSHEVCNAMVFTLDFF